MRLGIPRRHVAHCIETLTIYINTIYKCSFYISHRINATLCTRPLNKDNAYTDPRPDTPTPYTDLRADHLQTPSQTFSYSPLPISFPGHHCRQCSDAAQCQVVFCSSTQEWREAQKHQKVSMWVTWEMFLLLQESGRSPFFFQESQGHSGRVSMYDLKKYLDFVGYTLT